VLPYLLSSGTTAFVSSAAVCGLSLFLVGALISLFTGRNVLFSGVPLLVGDKAVLYDSTGSQEIPFGCRIKRIALGSGVVRDCLHSADSMAWSFAARRQGRDQNDWREARAFAERIETMPVQYGWVF